MSSYYFASLLEEDEESQLADLGEEEMFRQITRELAEAGEDAASPFAPAMKPAFGLSERQLYRKQEGVAWALPAAREDLRGRGVGELVLVAVADSEASRIGCPSSCFFGTVDRVN